MRSLPSTTHGQQWESNARPSNLKSNALYIHLTTCSHNNDVFHAYVLHVFAYFVLKNRTRKHSTNMLVQRKSAKRKGTIDRNHKITRLRIYHKCATCIFIDTRVIKHDCIRKCKHILMYLCIFCSLISLLFFKLPGMLNVNDIFFCEIS